MGVLFGPLSPIRSQQLLIKPYCANTPNSSVRVVWNHNNTSYHHDWFLCFVWLLLILIKFLSFTHNFYKIKTFHCEQNICCLCRLEPNKHTALCYRSPGLWIKIPNTNCSLLLLYLICHCNKVYCIDGYPHILMSTVPTVFQTSILCSCI